MSSEAFVTALHRLAEPGALAVAGCTDLFVEHAAVATPDGPVVDLGRLAELRGIVVRDDALDVGAAVTFAELRRHEAVRAHLPSLAAAAATVGALQIQNRATLGGNIANASPAGDSLPVLLALSAELVLASREGERTVPYDDFHTGYRATVLRAGELIHRVRIPLPPAENVQRFVKVGTRQAQAISKVSLACFARRDAGRLHDVRLAAGSVAATPVRLTGVEEACEGQRPDATLAHEAGRLAAAAVQPLDDVRSTAAYRRFALARVVRRVLLEAGEGVR
jgi:xanthine dehydrogenase small subunit